MPKPVTHPLKGINNTLFYGDNLPILREHIPDESVDLVYLDPPFNSQRAYNVPLKDESGMEAHAQIMAFQDTWNWDESASFTYQDLVENAPTNVARMISAMRDFIGPNPLMAYLVMMTARLIELRRVLKPTGSIYLHCDPTASHYLKIVLDTIFGMENFRNEIIWQRTNVHSDSKTWSAVSDTILFYTKSNIFTWNPVYLPLTEEHLESKYRNVDSGGRRYTLSDMTSPNPRPNMMYEWKGFISPQNGWRYSKETMAKLDTEGRIWYPTDKSKRPRLKRYLDEMPGRLVSSVWTDISPINSQAQERLGYPTQKPLSLLERIIQASSNEGDVILDPFCGCGTAVVAAQKLNRKWLGIDITHLSIALMKFRLLNSFEMKAGKDYQVIGEPEDLASAKQLAQDNRYQFQFWALSLIDAKPLGGETPSQPSPVSGGRNRRGPTIQGKKGADKGIDGVIAFLDDAKSNMKSALVQVKSGHVNSSQIRDLVGTVQRENAALGIFITLEPATKDMSEEAFSAGWYMSELWQKKYPRIQILTIEQLLDGAGVQMPPSQRGYKKAERIKRKDGTQNELGL
jgi:site-specific DNA-methyltransferase (adenine-specific)